MQALTDLVPFVDVGLGGLVVIGLIMIFTGRLVPSNIVDKLLAGRDARITELTAVVASEQERNTRQSEQITALLESGKTTAHALEEIRRVAEQGPGEGT